MIMLCNCYQKFKERRGINMDIKKLIYDGVSKVAYNEARKNISDSACLFLHYQPVCPDGVKKMVQANTK